ncbi:MAG: TetR/AcrR family transcriptional regulator [Candidatus Binatia bacterium]
MPSSSLKAQLREQNHANVRSAILDAARQLFAQEGVAGLSMRRLAEKIGYTPRTIYLYFVDKDDLLSELIEEEVGHLADCLESAFAKHRSPQRRLEAVALAYVAFGLEHPQAYEAIFMLRNHPLTRESAHLGQHVQGKRMLEVLDRAVRESGHTRAAHDHHVIFQALRCALHGVTSLLVLGRKLPGVQWEAVVKHLVAGVGGEASAE